MPASPGWTRSSFCSDTSCVEVARVGDFFLVRDSKNPGSALRFTKAEWDAFLEGVRAGDLD
jgi:hypothetical protein